MNTLKAFAMGEANRHKELMVFDWDKAARLIKESGCKEAAAGLSDDWEWTGGSIFTDGAPDYDGDTFLASTWAVPELKIYSGEWSKTVACYKMQSETPGWGSDTKWPDSALAILNGGGQEMKNDLISRSALLAELKKAMADEWERRAVPKSGACELMKALEIVKNAPAVNTKARTKNLECALAQMVYQYCQTGDGYVAHGWMLAAEQAFAALGIENYAEAEVVEEMIERMESDLAAEMGD